MKKARIIGLGSYLPERVLTNADLETMVETNDEWIVSRTGMKERRIAAENESTSDLGVKAAREALLNAKVKAEEIDLIICATMSPDFITPSTSCLIQAQIGALNAATFDLGAACCGFIYALNTAKAFVESGIYRTVLIVAAEKISPLVDYQDRNTCVLFGDGAAASVVSLRGAGFEIGCCDLGAEGALADLIIVPAGGSRSPFTQKTLDAREHYIRMAGREVFKNAVRRMCSSAEICMEKMNLKKEDISWLVPHQANLRIMDAVAEKAEVPLERVYKTVHKYGNTSASGIAIALKELLDEQPITPGSHILLVAFGAGLTFGAVILTKIEN